MEPYAGAGTGDFLPILVTQIQKCRAARTAALRPHRGRASANGFAKRLIPEANHLLELLCLTLTALSLPGGWGLPSFWLGSPWVKVRYGRIFVRPDVGLTPPKLEVTVSGFAGGTAGSGAPTMSMVRTPATFVNTLPPPPTAGSGL